MLMINIRRDGFALPSIMIASFVMLAVLVVTVSSIATTRAALNDQYYNQLAKEASESGVAVAEACVLRGAVWSNPLRPGSDCAGLASQCAAASCYMTISPEVRTTFRVDANSVVMRNGIPVEFLATGTTEVLRRSNGAVWKSYEWTERWVSSLSKLKDKTWSQPVGASIGGYWSVPPEGYLFENGAAVSRTLYADLFAVIGTTYGAGNGTTTFNLPDSRGRAAVNLSSTDTEFNALGKKFGEKTNTLSVSQIPSHSHDQVVTANSGGPSVRIDYKSDASGGRYPQGITTGSAGGSLPHNNIQPSITKQFAIKYSNPESTGSEMSAGQSIDGYWATAPAGYLVENGAAVSRTTYADLFAVIGTTYGAGNGTTTFNLPDSRGRTKVALNAADAEFATLGGKYGAKTHTLSLAELPSHSHAQYNTANSGGSAIRRDYTRDGNGHIYAQGMNTGLTGGGAAHNNIQPSIVKLSVIKYTASTVVAGGAIGSVPRGSSVASYAPAVPSGYLLENGAAVSRTTYADLFAVIGTTYGAGNGTTTFNLPDSRGRAAVNLSSTDTEFNALGKKFGGKTHVLTAAEMPSHAHDQMVTALSGGSAIRNDYSSDGNGDIYTQGVSTNAAGGSGAHNNIQPSIALYFYIKY